MVSGPARGQMWADNTADDDGFQPLCDNEQKTRSHAASAEVPTRSRVAPLIGVNAPTEIEC